MKENWEISCDKVLESEGGYKLTNIPGDAGGQTYAGIARVPNPHWEGWAYIDRGETPPKSLVRDFYKASYWNKVHGDDLPAGLDYAVYDFAVNAGPGRAAKLLQRAVGVADDGIIGPGTMAAIAKADPHHALDQFSAAKELFYNGIVSRDPSQAKFIKGWLNRVAHVQQAASTMLA